MNRKILAFILGIWAMAFGIMGINAAVANVELYISAASSLTDALLEIQKNYESKNSDVKLNLNFASSGKLQTQIEQGAPADLFISAAAKQMDALEEKGLLLKGTRQDLLVNQLVLIVPKDSKLNLTDFKDLAADTVKNIGIGAPESVPVGQYAVEVFKYLKVWDKIQSKAILGTNVRVVLTYVETGNVDAGIVYQTDTVVSDKVKIIAVAPAGSHEPIIYPAAVLSGTKQAKAAQEFMTFLSNAESRKIFEKYGFVTK